MKQIPESLNRLRSDLHSPTWAGYLSQKGESGGQDRLVGRPGVTPTLLDPGTSLSWVWIERELAEVPESGQDPLYMQSWVGVWKLGESSVHLCTHP